MFENIQLPIILKSDTEYLDVLKETFETLTTELNTLANDNTILDTVKESTMENIELINDALESYFKGDVATAQKNIYSLLEKYKENKHIIVAPEQSYAFIDDHAFKKGYSIKKEELSFFRARIGSHLTNEDMGHIPLDKRSLVATQRFSIPGIPCLYLGTTSYACWLELNKPADHLFSVSHYSIKKPLKILDLAIPITTIINYLSYNSMMLTFDKDFFDIDITKEHIYDMLELIPLVIATSFVIKGSDKREFKIEYIISHLVMNNLTKLNIDGVAYLSKRFNHDYQAKPLGVILALPILSEVTSSESVDYNAPLNFAEFKMIPHDMKESFSDTYLNARQLPIDEIFPADPKNFVYLGNMPFEYKNSPFKLFDNCIKRVSKF